MRNMRNIIAAIAGFAVIYGIIHLSATNPAVYTNTVVITAIAVVFAAVTAISIIGKKVG